MNGERPSRPPVSAFRPAASRFIADRPSANQEASAWRPIRSGALKAYRDDALLERVQHRLEAAAKRPAWPRAGWQAAAALLLFGIGVGVGRGLPSFAGDTAAPEAARVTAETTRAGAADVAPERPAEVRDARVRPPPRPLQRKALLPAVVASVDPAPTLPSDAAAGVDVGVAPGSGSALGSALPSYAGSSLRSNWLELAGAGDYVGALAELERSQVAHFVLATGSVEELMTMAEVARFAGNQERAIQALSQVVDRYGGDANAPLAAMMLGNLLSRSGDSAGAARAFALNRTLSPGGDFAEDSLVREFDLALAAGNAALASSLFDQYAREFPAGPRIYAMRYELDELIAASERAAADSEAPPSEQGRSEQGRSETSTPEKDEPSD